MQNRFETLDAFRGLCAISVMVFHMHFSASITEWSFFRKSDIFVDFFFVLSGFVLAHGYAFKEKNSFSSFALARFFRLYPLHFFMFLVFVILEISKFLASDLWGIQFNNAPFSGGTHFSEILPNLLLIQSWTYFTSPLSFNFPSWSISVEFYVCLLFFFTFSFFKKYKIFTWLAICLPAIVLLSADLQFLREEAYRGLSSFFAGALTYVVYKQFAHINFSYGVATIIEIGTLLIVFYCTIYSSELGPAIPIFVFTFSVIVFSFEAGFISSVLRKKLFQTLGKLSYSIYLTHAAFLFVIIAGALAFSKISGIDIAPTIDGQRYIDLGSSSLNTLAVLFFVTMLIFLSNLTYQFIELKGISFGKRLRNIIERKADQAKNTPVQEGI